MEFHNFTPLTALAGGSLIGLSAVFLLLTSGQIAGVSGLVQGALINESIKKRADCLLFLGGLVLGSFLHQMLTGTEASITLDASVLVLVIGGIFIGFGTSLGGGCTSGHGICGLSRRSVRSLVATVTFMAAGVATVYMVRHVLGA